MDERTRQAIIAGAILTLLTWLGWGLYETWKDWVADCWNANRPSSDSSSSETEDLEAGAAAATPRAPEFGMFDVWAWERRIPRRRDVDELV